MRGEGGREAGREGREGREREGRETGEGGEEERVEWQREGGNGEVWCHCSTCLLLSAVSFSS